MNEIVAKEIKSDRVMELFFRLIKGESLSVQRLADEYHVSTRSITRDINSLKSFLADHRETLGYSELEYSSSNHCYRLRLEHFLTNKELLVITKILIGSRALNHADLLEIIRKLKQNTSTNDREQLEQLIHNELYHYSEIGSDCKSILDHIWKLTECIHDRHMITISYYKMSRELVKRRLKPVSILFSEYYFYLIAYKTDEDAGIPYYFRIDRITNITIHRETYTLASGERINEGELRKKSQFMWPGPERHIRFAFSGPSVQAILDRIPTARVIDCINNEAIIEADVFGEGIRMFLLSQGSWVRVLAPESFAKEMKQEIEKMAAQYQNISI